MQISTSFKLVFLFLFYLYGSAKAFGQNEEVPSQLVPGILVEGYQLENSYERIMPLIPGQTPNKAYVTPEIFYWHPWHEGFNGFTDNFILHLTGFITVEQAGNYQFKLSSDDGSRMYIDDQLVIDNDGLHGTAAKEGSIELTPGQHSFKIEYFQGSWWKTLMLEWLPPGAWWYSHVPASVFTHQDAVLVTSPGFKKVREEEDVPGNGLPLAEVHPSYDLQTVRQMSFQPKVAGMDFLPDGRLVVSTWEENKVYIVDGVQGNGPYQEKEIADGLTDPLGLKVVNGDIYVMERGRLLKLIDEDGDEITDVYQTVSTGWGSIGNFHEFDNGLVYKDGYFFATLTVAIDFGGSSSANQHPDRGKALKIDPETGAYEFVASGLRSPNGVGTGVDGEVFITDNQGDWLPANKLIHLQKGAFYGHRDVDPQGTANLDVTPPALYLPHNLIANSPSQPAPMYDGPYAGQMIFGDVTYGGVTRAFLEKVNGVYQGAAFRFTQGLEAGINRLCWGPDGAIYVGGIGAAGNWGQFGKLQYGLQRLTYNGKAVFDLLAVRARSDGFELEFTQPIQFGIGDDPSFYTLVQWTYEPTTNYGGPPVNESMVAIESVKISDDRTRVFLQTSNAKKGYVIHLRVNQDVVSEQSQTLWNAEAWYTLNEIPENTDGQVALNQPNARAMQSKSKNNAVSQNLAQEALKATVYPNPAKDWIAIQLEPKWKGELEITLTNLEGKNVYVNQEQLHAGQNNEFLLNLVDFPKGMYYLQLVNLSTQQKQVYKILKK